MTSEGNTKNKKKLLDNFRPVRKKKYENKKTDIKNLEAELAQLKGQQSQEEKTQSQKDKDKKGKGIKEGLSTVFRTVRKSSYVKRRKEIEKLNADIATLKNSQSTEQSNNTETVASSSNTTSTPKQQERERERAKPKLKIDPVPSTSTAGWLNTPTPKNDKKFSFHSKEPTEETIAEEEKYDSEDFITNSSNLKNKDKQKHTEEELTTENQNSEGLIAENDKLKTNTLWLRNQICQLENTAQVYYNYAEQEIKKVQSSRHQYNNLLTELEATFNELSTQQGEIKNLQAQLDYQKNLNQDQEKEYLGQIKIKGRAIRLAQERLDDLEEQILQLRFDNLRNNSQQENNSTSNLSPLLSNKPSDLISYESQSDEKSSDEEAEIITTHRPKNSGRISNKKDKGKETQLTWKEEIEQEEEETFASLGESSSVQPQLSNRSRFELENSPPNSTLQTFLQQAQQLETFSAIEKFEGRFFLETNSKCQKRQRTEAENNLINQINRELDRKKRQFTQIYKELTARCWNELSIDIGTLDSFYQILQTTKFSEIPALWHQTYQKIASNKLEYSRRQRAKSLTAQLRQIRAESAEVAANLVENFATPQKGWKANFQSFSNQVKKAQNYLCESYKNHSTTYHAVGLTALGAGVAYYNWESLAENLSSPLIECIQNINGSQVIATASSTAAFTCLPALNFNLNQPNQIENNLNLNWTNQTSSFGPQLPDFYEQILSSNCPANLIVDNQNLNKSSRTSSANTRSNIIKDKKQKKNCQKNRSTSQNLNTFFNVRSWLVNQNPSLENFEATELVRHDTQSEIPELSEPNKISQTSLEPVNNQTLTNQFQKLNELEQNLFNLGISANEINNISDRKTLFKYHPDKALINGLSAEKANEIFKNLSAYRSQLENFTSEAPSLLENSASQQPDKLMNETQVDFSPNGNQTETPFESSSIPLDYNSILGGSILIVGAGQLLAKYESQTQEKAAVKIQSLVRMHQAHQKVKREKERLAQEKAARESERNNQGQFFQSNYSSPSSTPPTNSYEEKTPSQNNNNTSSPSSDSENTTYSAPSGGNYSSGGTITTANFSSQSPSQLVQDILSQAQKAIQSQQIPQLETAEKQIVSLFKEKDLSKKQVYYQYQTQLENKLEKVVQTKTIQEIQVNHLDIAKQIKETIEPQKIQNKGWKEIINQLTMEKIPSVKKQIQSDILQRTKQAATESLESDLKLAQLIKWDIQSETNWKLIIKNATQEKEIKQEWEKNKQSLLAQSQEAVINNLNSLLGSELKIADLDQPFSEFPQAVYQKKLEALKAYQQQVASHIAEKKRNYSQIAQLNTVTQPESRWKNWILPLTVGGAGVIAGILALKHWLNSPKAEVNKNNPPVSLNPSTKIKLLIERYLTNLKKLQKNGYNAKLAQTIQKDFRQIQILMEEWLGKQKNKFEEKNWDDFQKRYEEYLKKN